MRSSSSLSALDGWKWVTEGARTLRQHWAFWLLWALALPGVFVLVGVLAAVAEGIGGGAYSTAYLMIVPLITGLGLVLATGWHAAGWAKALDQMGFRTFRWHDVVRTTLWLLIVVLACGLVIAGTVAYGIMDRGDHLPEMLLGILLLMPFLLVLGFLMIFMIGFMLDTTAGHTSFVGALIASARAVIRHWQASLIALLVLIALAMAVMLPLGILRALLPMVGLVVQAVVQPAIAAVGVLVLAAGFVQIRRRDDGLDLEQGPDSGANGNRSPAAPATVPPPDMGNDG